MVFQSMHTWWAYSTFVVGPANMHTAPGTAALPAWHHPLHASRQWAWARSLNLGLVQVQGMDQRHDMGQEPQPKPGPGTRHGPGMTQILTAVRLTSRQCWSDECPKGMLADGWPPKQHQMHSSWGGTHQCRPAAQYSRQQEQAAGSISNSSRHPHGGVSNESSCNNPAHVRVQQSHTYLLT